MRPQIDPRRLPPDAPPGGWQYDPDSGLHLPARGGRVVADCGGIPGLLGGRRRSSGTAPFAPTDIPTLIAWWDLAYLAGLSQDTAGVTPITTAAQTIGRVLDRSGNGNHLQQATSGARMAYSVTAGPNGAQPGAVYSGRRLTTVGTLSTVETHIFIVASHTSGGLWGRGNSLSDYSYRPTGVTFLVGYGGTRGGSPVLLDDGALWATSGTYGVYTYAITPSGSPTVALWRDGVAKATNATAVGTSPLVADFTIGDTASSASNAGNGTLLLALIYGALTAPQRAQVEAYCKAQCGTP